MSAPAAAQATRGGDGGLGGGGSWTPGGTSSVTGAGSNGANAGVVYAGGGGGGAGATGGAGGTGGTRAGGVGTPGAGGAGGATPGANGQDGQGGPLGVIVSGGGGGGGAHGAVTAAAPVTATTGGRGGDGGDAADGDGGGGGAGGYGVVSTGSSGTFQSITGGNGGNGGDGYFYSGGGGDGGHGLVFTSAATASVNGAVTGGTGGTSGILTSGSGSRGASGAGGIGITGSDVNLTLGADVAGGLSGAGVRANALRFGGSSGLTLGTGWGIVGGIDIANGTLTLAQGTDVTIANVVSGAGRLAKTGAGIVTLTGANSYQGGTTVTGGLINFASGTNLGSGNITLNGGGLQWATGNSSNISARLNALGSGGATFDTNGNNVSLTGNLSGAGAITKSGAGTLTLSGTNTYSGGTTIGAGTVVQGSAGALGSSGTVTLAGGLLDLGAYDFGINRLAGDFASLTASGGGRLFLNTGSATIGTAGGLLALAVPLRVGAGGTLTLLGDNDLTGGIALAGRLVIGETGAAGGSGNTITTTGSVISYADGVDNPAAIVIGSDTTQLEVLVDVDVATQSGVISETGGSRGFAKIGAGTLIVTGSNTYTGGTTVSAGTLGLGVDTSAGTGAIFLADGTRLLNASCSCTPLTIGNAIAIAPAGTATIDTDGYETLLTGTIGGGDATFADSFGGGLFVLTGSNTYDATTIESLAEVQVGDGGIAGSLGTGSVVNHGALVFDRSDDISFSQEISGKGVLVQAGHGTLTLTGTNSYTGGTVIDAGTLRVGDGGTAGTLGSGDIENYGTLVFDRSDAVTVADDIYGGGGITKLGAGTLTLSGFNSYTGTTSVLDGTVAITSFALGSSQLTEIGNGARLLALEDAYAGDMRILASGGTIDTGAFTLEVLGGVDFQGLLTKTGSGTLILSDIFETGGGDGGIDVTAGTLGLGNEYAAGTGTIWLADGTTLLNASCGCGDLTINNDIEIALGGAAAIDANGHSLSDFDPIPTTVTLNGSISGGNAHFVSPSYFEGAFEIAQPGIFVLNGANAYGQTLIGANVAVILEDGTLGTGDVVFDGDPSDPLTPATLVFANSENYTFGGRIVGDGGVAIETLDPETTITLSGSNTPIANFTGTVDVASGHLAINGDFGDVLGDTATLLLDGCGCGGGPTLGGSGTFHGNVELRDASLNPGNSPGTLTIAGDLALGGGTILNYELGASGTPGGLNNDLVNVGGNLTLDGTLNTIAFGAGYASGYYRLFNYSGTLTDNTLDSGSIAGGLSSELLFNIPGQVNLRLGPQVTQYWDGADVTGSGTTANGDGGAGTWSAANTNWTAAAGFGVNDAWRSATAVFGGASGGPITVDGTQAFQELQFQTDGYVLQAGGGGGELSTTGGFSIVGVDSGLTADIGVAIGGAAGLAKTGAGALILSAQNSYAGTTDITAGTLRMGTDSALNSNGALTVAAGATLELDGYHALIGSLSGAGSVLTGAGGLSTGNDNTSTLFSGGITGAGTIAKLGTGNWTLGGSSSASYGQLFDGTLTIANTGSVTVTENITVFALSGTPTLVNGGAIVGRLNTLAGVIDNDGTITGIVENRSPTFTNDGTITSDMVRNFRGGILTNNGLIAGYVLNGSSGTGTFNNAGTVTGDFSNDIGGTLHSTGIISGTLTNSGTASVRNQLNGTVSNSGLVTLTGVTTGIALYYGLSAPVLDLAGFDTAIDAVTGGGEIRLGSATLTLGGADGYTTFSGVVSGTGALTKDGAGDVSLSGANTYSGLTTINDGSFYLTGSLAGAVQNNARFTNDGTVSGGVTGAAGSHGTNRGTIAGGVDNSGTFSSTGTINLGVQNQFGGLFEARGQINGPVTNNGGFVAVGALTGIGTFLQSATGQTNLDGFDLTVGSFAGDGLVYLGGGNATLTTGGNGIDTSFLGSIFGQGNLTKVGGGELTLAGANGYTGTTTISGGSLRVSDGGSLGGGDIVDNGTLFLEQSGPVTLGLLKGSGQIFKTGTGSLEFTGNNTAGRDFTGSIDVAAGSLVLNGVVGDTAGRTAQLTMSSGTSLGGTGSFMGSAAVFGSLGAGNSPGTLTIAGDLTLGAGTILNYELGASGIPGGPNNDLVVVGGNLTLDGTLNTLAFGAGYGPGYYRLFNYDGGLTDNGLTIGSIAGGLSATVLTNIGHQVNVVLGPQLVQYWDGGDMTGASATVNGDGGNGTWNSTNANWTSATGFGINDQWRSQIGVFAGNPGGSNNVTIVGTQSFQELRFETGYTLMGATVADGLATTGGFSVIDVQGSVSINAPISGAGGLTKTGSGTLVLGGNNTYTGLTTISGPSTSALVLVPFSQLAGAVLNNARLDNMGTIQGLVTNNGTMESFNTLNGGLVNSGTALIGGNANGILTNLAGGVVTLHNVSGVGAVSQAAGGTLILDSSTTIGSLAGAGTVDVQSFTLTTNGDNSSTTFAGVLSGFGGLTKAGTGTLTLVGANTYTNPTSITGGTLAITSTGSLASGLILNTTPGGTLTNAGTIGGAVINGGTLSSTGTLGALSNSGTASLAGQLNGGLGNAGTVTLTGTLTGVTTLSQTAAGTFNLAGFDTEVGSLEGDGAVDLGGGLLTVGSLGTSTTFSGDVSGSGGLTKVGTGTLTLGGFNAFSGDLTIAAGTLALGSTAALFGEPAVTVASGATFDAGNYGPALGSLSGAGTVLANTQGLFTGSNNTSTTFTGTFTSDGIVAKTGTGTWTLGGAFSSRSLQLQEGSLSLAASGAISGGFQLFGASSVFTNDGAVDGDVSVEAGNVDNNGTITGLVTNRAIFVNDGTIDTSGTYVDAFGDTRPNAIFNADGGVFTNNGPITGIVYNGTYGPGTFDNAGTIDGAVTNGDDGSLTSTGAINATFANSGTASIRGQLNGPVANSGTLALTGITTGIGAVTQTAAGTFALGGFSTAIGSLSGAGQVQLGNATLTTGGDNTSTTFSGVISNGAYGTDSLTKVGSGTLALSGFNTYRGDTRVSAGTLLITSTGRVDGDVFNDATFVNDGTVGIALDNAAGATRPTPASSLTASSTGAHSRRRERWASGPSTLPVRPCSRRASSTATWATSARSTLPAR